MSGRGRKKKEKLKAVSTKVEAIIPSFMPKPYQSQPKQTRRFRYNCTAAASAVVTRALLLNRMVFQETGSTQNNRIIKSIRLDRVTVYGTGTATSNGMRTLTLLWSQNQVEINAIGNAAFPPKISSKPPAETSAGWWSITGVDETEVIFIATCIIGDIIDIDVTYTLADGFAAFVTTTPSASADGLVYPWLDATSVVGSFAPTSLQIPY